MKKFFAVLVALMMFAAVAGSAFAGDRRGGHHDYRGGHSYGLGDAIVSTLAIVGTVAVVDAITRRQQGYSQQQCWMESRPLYDAGGRYVTNQWVQVCAQP